MFLIIITVTYSKIKFFKTPKMVSSLFQHHAALGVDSSTSGPSDVPDNRTNRHQLSVDHRL